MRGHSRITPWLLAGLAASTIWLLVLPDPGAEGGDKADKTTTAKKDTGKNPGKDDEVKPGPYPEDALLHPNERGYNGSGAYRWLNVALQATAREHERHGARPTIGSRNLGMCTTAMFDAWAAYDAKAVGTRPGDKLRGPPKERTLANKNNARAYAVTRVLLDIYAEDAAWIKERVKREKEGVDPDDLTTDISTPQGVGNVAAAALLAYRHHDGANQLGDERGSNGKPYSDYT